MVLTSVQAASLADRQRVWQVRRFCQVRLAHVQPVRSEDHGSLHVENGDAALSALLRCLLYELDADLAAISLLDEQTQYFLSVVQKSAIHDPTVREADWFGCTDRIPVRGGICERTITRERTTEHYPVYEILDLLADEATVGLPVVNGEFASFKSYAGVPLTSPDGLHIGALFVFKDQPQLHYLSPAKRRFLCQTARYTMNQLMQTVGALENKRSLRCNSSASSFLDNHELNEAVDIARESKITKSTNQHTLSARHVHETAASQLLRLFELDSVMIQELPRFKVSKNIHLSQREHLLAYQSNGSNQSPALIEDSIAERLLQSFPTGAILQSLSTDEGGVFIASTQGESGTRKVVRLNLHGRFQRIEQFLFMPLRDSFHDRDSAFILGWTSGFTRVYNSATDLPSLSFFGAAIMTQVRRFEAQALSRKQSDFLGSISHEMRSPLHGFLSLVSHLRDTECSAEQIDLLESAESCGLLLQSNIDNILMYSSIGSPSSKFSTSSQLSFLEHQRTATSTLEASSLKEGRNSMLAFIEDSIDRADRQSKSTQLANELRRCSTSPSNPESPQPGSVTSYRTMTIVDATPTTNFPLMCGSEVRIIISSLLDNCLKFTDCDACIRVSLETDGDAIKLLFVDSGRGISPDFLRNSLFVPFAQQNPLDTGTGLGLSIVEGTVQALNGELRVETDESVGTEVSVLLPRSRLVPTPGTPDSLPTELDESKGDAQGLLSLTMRLFQPTRWHQTDNLRQKRSLVNFTDSLATTLRTWLDTELQSGTAIEEMPGVMFVFDTDLQLLKSVTNDGFEHLKKVIFCPDAEAEGKVKASKPGTFATIVGAITPSKICRAVSLCHRIRDDSNTDDVWVSDLSTSYNDMRMGDDKEDISPKDPVLVNLPQEAEHVSTMTLQLAPRTAKPPLVHANTIQIMPTRDPRFLLVDDNAINLKVVAMFAKKCSSQRSVLAGGGREAINALKATPINSVADASRFDIILLDLSMPEVSGFDVAYALREMERLQVGRPRTYIAALTGLVSSKDRDAAFAAGVDEYVTKPATLNDLLGVVTNWKIARSVP